MEEIKKIGVTIVKEGTKSVTFGAGLAFLSALVKDGMDGVKKLDVDKLLK